MNVNQERMQTLLVETVTMLCRNGLTFQTDIRVQGLLGITVDGQEVILVSMDEKIDHGYTDSTSLRGLGDEKQPKKLQNKVNVPRTVASRQNRNVSGNHRAQYLALQPSSAYGVEQAITSPTRFVPGGDVCAFDTEYSDQVPAHGIKQCKAMSSSTEFSGAAIPEGLSQTVRVNDDAIFIESDDDENVVKQEDFVENDRQQTSYRVDGELQAGCSNDYFVPPNSQGMFSGKVDPDHEQQQYMNYSLNTESEDYTHDADIKMEHLEQSVEPWSSASGVAGNVRKFRKPMQHFGNRGLPSWRRKPAHKVSSSRCSYMLYHLLLVYDNI